MGERWDRLQIQTVIFGFLLASLYGALFHFWKGGKPWRLLVFLFFAWIGFWAGQLLGQKIGLVFIKVGSLNVGFASLMSLLALAIGTWLILGRLEGNPERKS